jgi:paraquat-inducible protein B
MSKKANPTVIGVFIVAGLALAVIGLVVFSSGNLFGKKHRYILYFSGSLKGMDVGAPVQFKGVTIGKVVEIYVTHNQASDDFALPVVIEIDDAALREKTDRQVNIGSPERLKEMIARGLRGRLDSASLVTGVLIVQLDFVRNPPPAVYHQIKPEYMELPTAPTQMEMLFESFDKIDLQGMIVRLNVIFGRVDTMLGQVDVPTINAGVTNLLASLNTVIASPNLTNSLASLHQTLDEFGALAKNVNTNSLVQIQVMLAELRTTTQGLSTMLAPDSRMQTELTGALEQLNNAARSLAELVEFLKRNPNALITGRKPPKEKP